MKSKIIDYLKTNRSFEAGLRLYMEHGKNLAFKNTLNRQGKTEYNQKMLYEELRKLAGLSDTEYKAIMSKSVSFFKVPVAAPAVEVPETTGEPEGEKKETDTSEDEAKETNAAPEVEVPGATEEPEGEKKEADSSEDEAKETNAVPAVAEPEAKPVIPAKKKAASSRKKSKE